MKAELTTEVNQYVTIRLTIEEAKRLSAALESMPWSEQTQENAEFLEGLSELIDDATDEQTVAEEYDFPRLKTIN